MQAYDCFGKNFMPSKFFRGKSSVLKTKKKNWLLTAISESTSAHPDNPPHSLCCPISLDLIVDPVITPEGFVYDRKNILKCLQTKQCDPQTRTPLQTDDLVSFPELSVAIECFKKRQTSFTQIKNAWIIQARQAAHSQPVTSSPAMFLCPISRTLMKDPVITKKGAIYDKQSLIKFLRENNNKDKSGEQLSAQDYQGFPEFHEQMKVHQYYYSRQQEKNEEDLRLTDTKETLAATSPWSFFNYLCCMLTSTPEHADSPPKPTWRL